MIIVLKNADFSQSNIGTLSSWRVFHSLGPGAIYNGPALVDKDAAFSATITIAEGYEIVTAGVSIAMGGIELSDAYSISGNVITINIAPVIGNILINVNTSKSEQQNTYTITWEAGGIDVNKGTYNNMSNRRRTVEFIPIEYAFGMTNITKSIHVLFFDNDYNFLVHTASSATETISLTAEIPTSLLKYMPEGAAYMKLVARTGDITQDEHWYPLYSSIEHLFNPASIRWEAGGIDTNTGIPNVSGHDSENTRRRTIDFIPVTYKNATTSNSVDVHVLYYDSICKYLGTTNIITMSASVAQNLCAQAPNDAAYYKLLARTADINQDNYWSISK